MSVKTGRKLTKQTRHTTVNTVWPHCRRGGEQQQAKAAYRVPDKVWNLFLSMAQTQNSHQAAHRTTSGKCHKGRPTGRERRHLAAATGKHQSNSFSFTHIHVLHFLPFPTHFPIYINISLHNTIIVYYYIIQPLV